MHLDTVFTQINVDTFSIYPPIIRNDLPCWTLTPKNEGIHFQQELDYRKALEKALQLDKIQHITTGVTALPLNVNNGMMPIIC